LDWAIVLHKSSNGVFPLKCDATAPIDVRIGVPKKPNSPPVLARLLNLSMLSRQMTISTSQRLLDFQALQLRERFAISW
jgi:hypothetical protein